MSDPKSDIVHFYYETNGIMTLHLLSAMLGSNLLQTKISLLTVEYKFIPALPCLAILFTTIKTITNTPGIAGGPGGLDRTLAVKS